jgi:hypothetical protein
MPGSWAAQRGRAVATAVRVRVAQSQPRPRLLARPLAMIPATGRLVCRPPPALGIAAMAAAGCSCAVAMRNCAIAMRTGDCACASRAAVGSESRCPTEGARRRGAAESEMTVTRTRYRDELIRVDRDSDEVP